MTLSLSQTTVTLPVALCTLSQICEANSDSYPMGEYFLKITSPSFSV